MQSLNQNVAALENIKEGIEYRIFNITKKNWTNLGLGMLVFN